MIVFIDDILIYSKTKEEHAEHIRMVLEILRKKDYMLNGLNVNFGLNQVHFLGHVINKEE